MYRLKHLEVFASDIAELLGTKLVGENCIVSSPATIDSAKDGSFFYYVSGAPFNLASIEGKKNIVVLTDSDKIPSGKNVSYIIISDPRLAFIRIINELFVELDPILISTRASISSEVRLGRGISIGDNSVLDGPVEVGNNTIICSNVVIHGPVKIGDNCTIRDNTTIGGEAFDFITVEDGKTVGVPHVGSIEIGSAAWIGSNVSIERGVINSTQIGENVKIDDLVQIGAGCKVGDGSLIMAGSILSRDVRIGNKVRVSPNCSIREEIEIGDGAYLGLGAVLVKNIEAGMLAYGNPARPHGSAGDWS